MKKIIILILAVLGSCLILFFQTENIFAFECQSGYTQRADESGCDKNPETQKIFTSEKVPGADCICVRGVNTAGKTEYDATGLACGGSVTNRKYECTVPTGLAGFQKVFAQIIRFVINIVLLLGVLAVVGLGIAWSFAGGDDVKAKSNLKKWAINILIGLVILFMFRYILLFLAPWVYQ